MHPSSALLGDGSIPENTQTSWASGSQRILRKESSYLDWKWVSASNASSVSEGLGYIKAVDNMAVTV